MSRLLPLWTAAVLVFLYAPLAALAVFSVNASRYTVWEGFSWRWYAAMLQDTQLAEAAATSLIIALLATVCASTLGTLCAYALWQKPNSAVSHTLMLSLVTPEIVWGVSLLALFQWAFRFLHLRLGLPAVVLAHTAFCLAYVVLVVAARLRSFDVSLEEAARDLGATPWHAFRLVTLPALLPGIVAAALLAFTLSFDDYVITSLIAGVDTETLPMVLYAMARRGANPVVNAVSTLVTVGLGSVILLAERLQRRV